MTAGPTRVKEIFEIPLGRPRSLEIRGSAEFAELRQAVWESLKAEVLKNPQFADVKL
jgi:NitT/TauT family transport system ATP-binding protein